MEKTLKPEDLNQFTGSENWFRHPLNRRVVFTEGAKHVADAGGAYWLLDAIALAQLLPKLIDTPFQVWKLILNETGGAVLSCEDGNGKAVFSKPITFTDFPLKVIQLWVENDVIYLPSER